MSFSKIFVLVLSFSVNYVSFSQTAFLQNGNLRTVFEMAKSQNKPVLIEVYSPDCHICQAFKPTFEQKAVGDFYNKNFVSYKLAIESEEAQGFLGKQNIWIPSIPLLLFFDKNVKLSHVAVMSETRNTAEIVINAGKTAMNPQARTSNYKTRFQNGEREANFLTEYALMARVQKDTLMNIEAASAYFKTQKPAQYTNSTNLLILEKAVMDLENPLFRYMINNLPKYYAVKEKAKVNTIAENILMWSLYSSRGQNYNSTKLNQIKTELAKVGVDAKSIAGRVWMHEARAYFRESQATKAMTVIEARIKGMNVAKGEAKFLCNFVKSNTSDKAAIARANKWCVQAK
jgi:thiol-disulfide isomerase/thioredoxin